MTTAKEAIDKALNSFNELKAPMNQEIQRALKALSKNEAELTKRFAARAKRRLDDASNQRRDSIRKAKSSLAEMQSHYNQAAADEQSSERLNVGDLTEMWRPNLIFVENRLEMVSNESTYRWLPDKENQFEGMLQDWFDGYMANAVNLLSENRAVDNVLTLLTIGTIIAGIPISTVAPFAWIGVGASTGLLAKQAVDRIKSNKTNDETERRKHAALVFIYYLVELSELWLEKLR